MRKLIIAGLAAMLIAGLVAGPAAASPAPTNDAAKVALTFSGGNCADIVPTHFHSGDTSSQSASVPRTGVRAFMRPSTSSFGTCIPTWIDFDGNGASIWVSLEPRVGTSTTILQIGVINCSDLSGLMWPWEKHMPGNSPCEGGREDTNRYFWAAAGCDGYVPNPVDLGPVTAGFHWFAIRRYPDGMYKLSISDVTKAVIPYSHPAISCWDQGQMSGTRAGYFAEAWDRNDFWGPPSAPSAFRNMLFMDNVNGVWKNVTGRSIGQTCPFVGTPITDECEFVYTNGFNVSSRLN